MAITAYVFDDNTLSRSLLSISDWRRQIQQRQQSSRPLNTDPLLLLPANGYNYRDKPGHNGDGCTSMGGDPTYTAAMKAAKAPANINGIKGSERNK